MAKGRKTGGGSRKGRPNKETKALRELILGALDKVGGEDYLARQAEDNPSAFLSLIGRVLPTTLATDPNAPMKLELAVRFEDADSKG